MCPMDKHHIYCFFISLSAWRMRKQCMSMLIMCPYVVMFCMPVVQQQYCCKIVCTCGSREQTKTGSLLCIIGLCSVNSC